MARRLSRTRDGLPMWVYDVLESYGIECALAALTKVEPKSDPNPWDDAPTPITGVWKDDR